ncbi:hypothetical protein AVEN_197929-1 [Araneus ventricosus]|uniref:Uncharacterized protein n=1 Tax=Araneus ventricosus TaxID=182803 RepID=A0A4Y2CJE4_ARAVE|nr:hypothetical protein AVEN_197929-1 [Araneus ventricosus]
MQEAEITINASKMVLENWYSKQRLQVALFSFPDLENFLETAEKSILLFSTDGQKIKAVDRLSGIANVFRRHRQLLGVPVAHVILLGLAH